VGTIAVPVDMRAWPHALLVLTFFFPIVMTGSSAYTEDDLNVKMLYLKKIERGDTNGISLMVSVLNQRHLVNVTYTGNHVDWQATEDCFENTSEVPIGMGGSVNIGIGISCPRDTSLGFHSDYIYIEYDVQDGLNGTWNSYDWMSEETADFEVIVAAKTNTGGGHSSFEGTLNYICPAMIVIAVIGAILMVVRDRRRAAQKRAQLEINAQSATGGYQYMTDQPAISGQYPSQGITIGMTGPGYPEYGDWTCPHCNSPASGPFCSRCGHPADEKM
jgi:hypothetical protein